MNDVGDNERRVREGRFCLCEGDVICDFHKRGGYVTAADNVDDYEVVWSGRDELLPPRDTKPDDTWVAPRRLYNKRNNAAKEQDNGGHNGNGRSGVVGTDSK